MTEGGSCHCVALCATHAASAALARKAGRHVALLPGLPRGGAGQRMAPSFSGQRRHVARGAPLPLYSRASSAKPDRDFAGSRLRIGPRPECTARTAAIARPGPRRRSSGCARTRRAGRRSRCPSADAALPGYVIHVSARSSVGPRRRAGVSLARRPAGGAPGRSAAAAPLPGVVGPHSTRRRWVWRHHNGRRPSLLCVANRKIPTGTRTGTRFLARPLPAAFAPRGRYCCRIRTFVYSRAGLRSAPATGSLRPARLRLPGPSSESAAQASPCTLAHIGTWASRSRCESPHAPVYHGVLNPIRQLLPARTCCAGLRLRLTGGITVRDHHCHDSMIMIVGRAPTRTRSSGMAQAGPGTAPSLSRSTP